VVNRAIGGGDARSNSVSNTEAGRYQKQDSMFATMSTIWAGNKRTMKLDDGWSAGLRDAIRLVIQGGNDLQQRTCEGRVC
jgi:hypothetical protein